MAIGLVCVIIFVIPISRAIIDIHNIGLSIIITVLHGLLYAMPLGAFPGLIANAFPVSVRSTGIGLVYNIPFAIITGTFPLVSLIIAQYMGSIYYQYVYVIILIVIALLSLITYKAEQPRKDQRMTDNPL